MNSARGPSERVVILGASDKPERYAFQALQMLREHGYEPIPVHPALKSIGEIPVVAALDEVTGTVDTLTLYVNPSISEGLAESMVNLRPGRVIFNPGTESSFLEERLEAAGISWEAACTLVLLRTGQF